MVGEARARGFEVIQGFATPVESGGVGLRVLLTWGVVVLKGLGHLAFDEGIGHGRILLCEQWGGGAPLLRGARFAEGEVDGGIGGFQNPENFAGDHRIGHGRIVACGGHREEVGIS